MNILLCCEHFYPSVGGVQKMMHELGRRFAMHGNRVTVATSWRADRHEHTIDGIEIVDFKVDGNAVSGMRGEIDLYRRFLLDGDFDFLLVMAAQQWTFDAMLPILDRIHCRKLHIPCGYSGFFLRKYGAYYRHMAEHLRKFDALIYNANSYRDIDYARRHALPNIHVIPAGASELEFLDHSNRPADIRVALGVGPDDFLYLSVGAPAYNKGHREILQAYLALDVPFKSTLILNGNYDNLPALRAANVRTAPKEAAKEMARRLLGRSPANIRRLAATNDDPRKKVVFANLPRASLIPLFFEADLFLFASHVEYSPLVIFECLAAGLPFLSIPVGNVTEIAEWSGGGLICPGRISSTGFSSADPRIFAEHVRALSADPALLQRLSVSGRRAWLDRFTWEKIALQIEQLVTQGCG